MGAHSSLSATAPPPHGGLAPGSGFWKTFPPWQRQMTVAERCKRVGKERVWGNLTQNWFLPGAISGEFRTPFPRRYIRACAAHDGAFFSKIEKLSHIIGTATILEIARAYGLRPRLWLLFLRISWVRYHTRHSARARALLPLQHMFSDLTSL